MDYKNLAREYFVAFSQKDLEKLESMFHEHVTLRDWEVSAQGRTEVMKANKIILDQVIDIAVTPLSLYNEGSFVIAELQVKGAGQELLVVDIIEFADDKIVSIRAYKG